MVKLKFSVTFLIICFFFAISSVSALDKDKIISEVTKVLLKQQEDWNRGDLTSYMNAYWNSDSLVFIGKSGPKFGWQTTLENYKNSYPDQSIMGSLKFTFIKFDVLSDLYCSVIGKWELKREKDSPSGYFSLILRKIDGNWFIISDHSS